MTNQNYINTTSNQELCAFYLDYINNYLTVDKMAEDYFLNRQETLQLLAKGQELYNNKTTQKGN